MRVEPILQLLANNGFGTIGVDLFAYYLSPEVMTAIAVMPSLAATKIDYELRGWRKNDGLQIIVRGPDISAVIPRAYAVAAALEIETETLLPSTGPGVPNYLVRFMRPVTEPIVYPQEPSGMWEASLNFLITYSIQS